MSITGIGSTLAQCVEPTSNNLASVSDGSGQPVPNLTMPKTIKVLRTGTGEIETVDFNYYVKNVMPNEWGMPGWPTETLKAGAMAVKTYGWMHVTTYHKYPGLGYDVKDSTADQVYRPGTAEAYTDAAVDATWNYTMTRDGQLFEPEYDSGVKGSLEPIYTNRLGQEGAVILGNEGMTWQQILHYYYDPMGVISIQSIDGNQIPQMILPVSDFKTNISEGKVPLTVQFTDLSKNATSWKWNFRDSDYSQEKNPTYTFTEIGDYEVILTSSNANGSTSKMKYVNVTSKIIFCDMVLKSFKKWSSIVI
jgi:hypothetical protein